MHRNKSGKDNVIIEHGIMRMINAYWVETDEKPAGIVLSKAHFAELVEEMREDSSFPMDISTGIIIDGVMISSE